MANTQASDHDWIWGLSSEQILTLGSSVFTTIILVFALAVIFRSVARGEFFERMAVIGVALGEFASSLIGLTVSGTPSLRTGRLDALLEKLERQSTSSSVLSRQTEEKIVSLFEDAIGAGLNEEIKLALESLLEKQVREEVRIRSLQTLVDVQTRLGQASRTASIRGFFNLAIGIGFAVAALVILRSAVELFSPSELLTLSLSQAVYIMGIRVSLALVITLIAYFFLSLYKRSLEDVKYYQNEMTIIGVTATSVGVAYDCEEDGVRGAVAEALLRRDSLSASPQPVEQANLIGRLVEKLIDKIPASK